MPFAATVKDQHFVSEVINHNDSFNKRLGISFEDMKKVISNYIKLRLEENNKNLTSIQQLFENLLLRYRSEDGAKIRKIIKEIAKEEYRIDLTSK